MKKVAVVPDAPPKKTSYFGKKMRPEDNAEILGITKIAKLLGYCECGFFVSENDLAPGKKTIIECPRCGVRTRKNRLLEESPEETRKKAATKRDYLDVGDVGYHDHVTPNELNRPTKLSEGDE